MRKIKKVLIAVDSFKGSCNAADVSQFLAEGLKDCIPSLTISLLPMADGGEGTVDVLLSAAGGKKVDVEVFNPLGQQITAQFGLLSNGSAVIEMAAASGLALISKEERNPLQTTSYGTGQLIKAALDYGCKDILVGLGGSATNDGGVGMAMALGVRFTDAEGYDLPLGAKALSDLTHIHIDGLDPRISRCKMTVACDVTNPLCGAQGASFVYGPQKGADGETVKYLDDILGRYASILKQDLGIDVLQLAGGGAAGGLGAGLVAFCGGQIQSGVDSILDRINFEKMLEDVDLVITGEGCLDWQTAFGKVPIGVAGRVKREKSQIPVIAIAGMLGNGYEELYHLGIDFMDSILKRPLSMTQSMQQVESLLVETGRRLGRFIRLCNMP